MKPELKPEFASSGSFHKNNCVCGGSGEAWKYFKEEEVKIVCRVCGYCPVCHPNLAQPILPNHGQVEIDKDEFSRLSQTKEWSIA